MVAQSKLSQVFNYRSWVHAVSGAAGGCIAMSTFYPLDTVRSRLQLEDPDKIGAARSTTQVIKEIVLGEGFQALYRGLGPVLQSLCISNFVYFYTFHSLKALSADGKQQSALRDLFLGSIAGILNVLCTTPFWVVNTRVRMRNVAGTSDDVNKYYKSLIGGLIYVAKTEGIRGLWSGTIPSLILVSNPALQFMMYELLKRNLMKFTGTDISSLGFFGIGALAKAFATVLTYPLQLVQTKQRHRTKQSSTTKHTSSDASMVEIMLSILKHQGFKGLFRGLEAKILQTVLTAALMFMAYEKIASTVGVLLKKPPTTVLK
ncbi:PREDICTED: peroxisomal membrane protein PMP34 [Rhagoletis zephyria]|uniref:peroxisomal membrane protein PMP34 n=1 Tax=Rhagoletis zephyria TaxID=28612 RepID=UPI0008118883|nr:PREDICTED: peroxisomal membrane protein PMP34 [Rhagoletis zephyria]XP_017487157.1 PREDICTED: peroxisomal membrane protein PMP34 [Rhagoletis zephyria]XP_017487160.1 PREDICTED: peroxisomal membrane protein PMP34 [Rhagoletis zephyria]XP_017487167.1 PREDICTED: peroxisomal membrane protein PMP34 [Rhagoletis zephyria]XP_017487174.1 PREDICTED: peroxisomal membrane protein PMP34 [Rhagoletis zephyria]